MTCEKKTYNLLVLIAFCISLLAGSGHSAEKPQPLLKREKALKLASTASRQKYPDADEVLAMQATKITYRKDGTYTQYDEGYVKILTEKGRRANRVVSSYFTIPYQLEEDCKILLVEVIRPDGSTKVIDLEKNSKLVVNSSSMSSNIYNPNDKIIKVNVADLKVGDTLHYYMYDNTRQPRAEGIYADSFMMEQTRPVLFKRVTVEGPADFPLKKVALRNKLAETVTFEHPQGQQNVWQWIAKDVPQAFPEPDSPALYSCLQRVLISTAADWKEVSAWYWNLSQPALKQTSPAMRAKVKELTAKAKTPQEKIRALFDFVSQKVRYMGITTEKTSPGYAPHPVKETFGSLHGVCRDKAALLVAMLRLAQIEAYPVLINNGPHLDKSVPLPFFNHAITAAKVGDKYILMDSTDESTRELLPSYLDNRSYLVATQQGDPLRLSPIIPAAENMLHIETTGEVSEKGNLKATSLLKFNGINDNIYRGYFARITPEERRRFFESSLKSLYGQTRLEELKIIPENLQDTSRQLEITLSFSASDIALTGGRTAMLPLPFLGTRFGMVNFVLGKTGLEKRRYPLMTDVACGVSESLSIKLPEQINKVDAMPVYKTIDNPQILWKRSLAEVNSNLMGKSEFLVKVVEFTPKQYSELKTALQHIEYNSRKMPVLALSKPPASANAENMLIKKADAIILSSDIKYEITGKHSWTETRSIKKKILNYAGAKDNAEIKIHYNPAWDTVKLERAIISTPDGKVATISKKEINIMDQSWNGQAPRYPGGKIYVASLPGVTPGCTIEYRLRMEHKERLFAGFTETFASYNPLMQKTVKIITSKNKMDFSAINSLPAPESEEVGVYEVHLSNVSPVERERMTPKLSTFVPTLLARSKDACFRESCPNLLQTFIKAATNQPKTTAKAAELTKGIKNKSAIIRTIRDYIVKNVRLAGPGFSSLPLSAITPADKTLQDGYGNTTDRGILFYAMLHALNLKPEFVLRTPNRVTLQTKGDPDIFDLLLIKVDMDGQPLWLNDTNEYSQLGTTPSEGHYALFLHEARFGKIEVPPAFASHQEHVYDIDLSDNGDALITSKGFIYGTQYGQRKKLYSEITPEKRRRLYQQKLSNLSQSAKAKSDLKTDFAAYPGTVEFSADIPGFAVCDGKYLYLDLPRTLNRIFGLRADTRGNPLFIGSNADVEINTLISLPEKFGAPLIAPEQFNWVSPKKDQTIEVEVLLFTKDFLRSGALGGPQGETRQRLIKKLAAGKNVLLVRHKADLTPAIYQPEFYPQLLATQEKLSGQKAAVILFSIPAGKLRQACSAAESKPAASTGKTALTEKK